nr:MAG TPA: hypothetical protein [Bacteriophage sp.]
MRFPSVLTVPPGIFYALLQSGALLPCRPVETSALSTDPSSSHTLPLCRSNGAAHRLCCPLVRLFCVPSL